MHTDSKGDQRDFAAVLFSDVQQRFADVDRKLEPKRQEELETYITKSSARARNDLRPPARETPGMVGHRLLPWLATDRHHRPVVGTALRSGSSRRA
jgi:hypothetical protein